GLDAGGRVGAIAALTAVPETSSYHQAAQIAAVRIQVASPPGRPQVSPDDLLQAGGRLARLKLDAIQMELLTTEILSAALGSVAPGPPAGGQGPAPQPTPPHPPRPHFPPPRPPLRPAP